MHQIFNQSPVFAASAQAAPISYDYCESSLRGNTGQAGDNDIKAFWDLFENVYGVNIVSSSRSGAYYNGSAQWVRLQFTFFGKSGAPITAAWFECYRDGLVPSATYHDRVVG